MEKKQRWQDWLNLVLGVWLFFSPFFILSATNSIPAWNSYFFGVIIAGFSIWALIQPERWEEWINLAIGVWLIVSPLFPNYTTEHVVMYNQLIVGIIVGIDALWAALSKRQEIPMKHA